MAEFPCAYVYVYIGVGMRFVGVSARRRLFCLLIASLFWERCVLRKFNHRKWIFGLSIDMAFRYEKKVISFCFSTVYIVFGKMYFSFDCFIVYFSKGIEKHFYQNQIVYQFYILMNFCLPIVSDIFTRIYILITFRTYNRVKYLTHVTSQ